MMIGDNIINVHKNHQVIAIIIPNKNSNNNNKFL